MPSHKDGASRGSVKQGEQGEGSPLQRPAAGRVSPSPEHSTESAACSSPARGATAEAGVDSTTRTARTPEPEPGAVGSPSRAPGSDACAPAAADLSADEAAQLRRLAEQQVEIVIRLRRQLRETGQEETHSTELQDTLTEIRRLRAQLPEAEKPPKKQKKEKDQKSERGTGEKKQRAPRTREAVSKREPLNADKPLFLRSEATPLSAALKRRIQCGCPAAMTAAETMQRGGCSPDAAELALATLIGREEGCIVCDLNEAILRLCAGDATEAMRQLLALKGQPGAQDGEVLFLLGVAAEVALGPDAAQVHYRAALAEAPIAGVKYFGLYEQDWGAVVRLLFITDERVSYKKEGAEAALAAEKQRAAVLALLRRCLWGKVPIWSHAPCNALASGYLASTCPTDRHLRKHLYTTIPHVLDPSSHRILSEHYRDLVASDVVNAGDRRTDRLYLYGDPAARFICAQLRPLVEQLAGVPLKASYTYLSVYSDQSELGPHLDRLEAEYVLTIQLWLEPEYDVWPLHFGLDPREPQRGDQPKPPPDRTASVVLRNGDGCLFRGRRLVHWREPPPAGCSACVLLVHYVDRDFQGLDAPGLLSPHLRTPTEVSPQRGGSFGHAHRDPAARDKRSGSPKRREESAS
eukprot:TRINITY_DN706_c3_g1_i1.p1 TRINITY_DN706_c3_g1~~TRINITY_DN706_c3_g1_i1.p1  ORF type:complete len:668 (+),score=180.95 TRINITY_DN706_c3_g1_i1:100-2004(+)